MTEKVSKVLNGFLNLSTIDKEEFMRELNTYRIGGIYKKLEFEKEVKYRSSVGPKNSICDCCGK